MIYLKILVLTSKSLPTSNNIFSQIRMTKRILRGRKYEEMERQELELLDTRFLIFREFCWGLPARRTLVCSPNVRETDAKVSSDSSIT